MQYQQDPATGGPGPSAPPQYVGQQQFHPVLAQAQPQPVYTQPVYAQGGVAQPVGQPITYVTQPQLVPQPIYATTAVAQPAPPRPNRSSMWLNMVCAFCFLIWHFLTLVWPTYFLTTLVILVLATGLCIVGMCQRRPLFMLPLVVCNIVQTFMSFLMLIFTSVDYRAKCRDYDNLSERTLQDAIPFDCEGDAVGIVFWGIAMGIYILISIGYSVFLFNSFYSLQQDAKLEMVNQANQQQPQHGQFEPLQPVPDPDPLSWDNSPVKKGFVQFLAAGTAAALFIVTMYVSFHNQSETVNGICPVESTTDYFFDQPETNDLGCCTWIEDDGTCCKQSACDAKPSFIFSGLTNADQDACSDVVGLLSCSFCRKDSGTYVTDGFDQYYICPDFCQEVYDKCEGGSGDAATWCQDSFNGATVGNSPSGSCFNAANGLTQPSHFLFTFMMAGTWLLIRHLMTP